MRGDARKRSARALEARDVGRRVRLEYADGSPCAEGVMLAHSLVPSVMVETDDGRRVWWRHDMGHVIDGGS